MKRLAAAGTFTLLAGAFGLLLLASIVFSCRQGGTPHEMGTDASSQTEVRSSVVVGDIASDGGVARRTAHRV